MNCNKLSIFLFCLFLMVIALPLSAVQTGESIPGFSVVSGTGHILIRDDLQGKKALLFYEGRSHLDTNEDFKDYIRSLNLNDDQVLSVAVIDCSDVGLFKKLWQDRLVDHSRKTGLAVYGDWNGNMKRKFSYPDDSSFIVVDEQGTVLYATVGKVSPSDYQKISGLIQ